MEVFANSEIGKVRSINEDSYYIAEEELGIELYIISDGMRTDITGGEIASRLRSCSGKKLYIK